MGRYGGDAEVGARLAHQQRVLHRHRHEEARVRGSLCRREAARLPPVQHGEPPRGCLDEEVAWVGVAVEDLAVHGQREGVDERRHDPRHLELARAAAAHLLDVLALHVLHAEHAPRRQRGEDLGHKDGAAQLRRGEQLARGRLALRFDPKVELRARQDRQVLDDDSHVLEQVRESKRGEQRHDLRRADVDQQRALHMPVLHLYIVVWGSMLSLIPTERSTCRCRCCTLTTPSTSSTRPPSRTTRSRARCTCAMVAEPSGGPS